MGIRHLFYIWIFCMVSILSILHLIIGLTEKSACAALIGISFGSVAGWLPHCKYLKR